MYQIICNFKWKNLQTLFKNPTTLSIDSSFFSPFTEFIFLSFPYSSPHLVRRKIILFYLFSRSSEEKNLRLDNFLLMQITENRIRNEINCAQTQLFGDGRREIS